MASNILIGMALVLGVLILVHEWGHFIVARMCGVRVDVFSIGFGPRLFGIKRGATDYRVSAFPLGGYVRMAGQDPSEIDSAADAAMPTGASDELMSKTRWQRALISVAGPAVNLIFPIILLTAFFALVGIPYSAYLDKPVVVTAAPANNPPTPDALQPGDVVLSIDGAKTPTWEDAWVALSRSKTNEKLRLDVENQGKVRGVEMMPRHTVGADSPIGYVPLAPIVDYVESGKPAKKADIRQGDTIVSVDGKRIEVWGQFLERIRASQGKTMELEILRDGQVFRKTVTPVLGRNEAGDPTYQIGASPDDVVAYKHVSVSVGFLASSRQTIGIAETVLGVVGKLFSGKVSVRNLHSVVEISRAAGNAVQHGPVWVVLLMAGMSINLGILNLLPIPILDGGNILLLTLEGIRRKDFSMQFKERFVQVGLVFLLVLFVYVMYNDVVGLIPTHS